MGVERGEAVGGKGGGGRGGIASAKLETSMNG